MSIISTLKDIAMKITDKRGQAYEPPAAPQDTRVFFQPVQMPIWHLRDHVDPQYYPDLHVSKFGETIEFIEWYDDLPVLYTRSGYILTQVDYNDVVTVETDRVLAYVDIVDMREVRLVDRYGAPTNG